MRQQQQIVVRQNRMRMMRMTENIVRKKLPNLVYYNDDHSKSPKCTDELTKLIGATYTLPTTWTELTKEIENGEYKIVFHVDMIHKSNTKVKDFIDSINTIIKFMSNHKPLRIMVLIKPDTTQYMVQQLKDAGVLGIGLDINYYSIEEVIESVKHHIKGEPYWPEHIINSLPETPKKSVFAIFRPDAKSINLYEYLERKKDAIDKLELEMRVCESWDDLSEVLKEKPCLIAAHVGVISRSNITIHEFVSMVETLTKLTAYKKVPIAIIIEKDTPLSTVKELQKANILGICLSKTSFDFDEIHRAVEALTNNIPYWPKHILQQLPGAKKTVTQNTIRLTSRQAQIVNLISERGLTNKKIAQALNITESTVKIHVSAILKAYGVRTRTQLALAAIK